MKLRMICFALGFAVLLTGTLAAQSRTQRDQRGATIEPNPGEQNIQRWVILVGVNEYDHIRNLQYCVNDVTTLRDELLKQGYDKDRIFCLTSRSEKGSSFHPTRVNIGRIIMQVFSQLREGDQLLIVLSGHGMMINDKSWFCPEDADPDRPNETMIAIEKQYALMAGAKATNKLLIVDACRNDPTRSTQDTGGQLKLPPPPQGIVLLSSCNEKEFSYEDGNLGHGVFTHFLIDGIRGKADSNRDGCTSLMELIAYICDETPRYTKTKFGAVQTPYFAGNTTNFLIAGTAPSGGSPNSPSGSPSPLDGVVDLSGELVKNGFSKHLRDINQLSSDLENYVEFGSVRLKDKLDGEIKNLNAIPKEEITARRKVQERIQTIENEIMVAREEIFNKTFVANFGYLTSDVRDYGPECSFKMAIPTGFHDRMVNRVDVTFPVPNVKIDGATSSRGQTVFTVVGNTDGIEELLRGKNKYRARMCFRIIWYDIDNNRPVADVLKLDFTKAQAQ